MTEETGNERAGVVALGSQSAFATWARQVFKGPVWVREKLPDALRMLRESFIDCIVVHLPDITLDVTQLFSTIAHASPEVVVVAVSPSRIDHDKELELLGAGVAHCLSLSANPDATRQVVATLRDQVGRVGNLNQKVRALAGALRAHEAWQAEAKGLIGALCGDDDVAATKAREASGELLAKDLSTPQEMGQTRRQVRRQLFLSDVCEQVVEMVRPQAEREEIRVELQSEPSAPAVWAERTRMVQLMVNLLSNAMRHTPKGGSIKVELKKDPSPIDKRFDGCCISVVDTGAGIAEEHLSQLFNAGFTTQRNQGHAGMGLAICKQVMDEHGGTLEVKSEEGKGSAFRCRLPVDVRQRLGKVRLHRVDEPAQLDALVAAMRELGLEGDPKPMGSPALLARELMADGGELLLPTWSPEKKG